MSSIFKKLLRETVIYGLGNAATRFIGFFMLPIYTRVFSPADYGVMDVIASMTALGGIVLTSGMETALSYYFFQFRDPLEQRKTVTTVGAYLFVVNALVALGVCLKAESIAVFLFDESSYATYLRVAIISIPFTSLMSLNFNIMRLQRKPWSYLALSVPQLVFSVLLNIYLVVVLRVGIIGVFWTNVVAAFLFSIIGLVMNRAYFGVAFDWSRLSQLLRYGLPLVIGGLSMWSINYLDRYFLLRFSTLEQIGLYSVGLRLASVMVFVTQAFRTANAPFQFEMASEANAPLIYSRTLTYFILVTSMIGVPLALFARPILTVLTTEAYVEGYKVVALLAYSAVAYGLYQLIGVGLLVTKRTSLTGVSIGIGALLNVAYLFLLVPFLGMVGAALATLLTHMSVVVILYVSSQRVYAIPYELKKVCQTVCVASLVIAVSFMIQPQGLWVDSLLALGLVIAFFLVILFLSFPGAGERRAIDHLTVRPYGEVKQRAR